MVVGEAQALASVGRRLEVWLSTALIISPAAQRLRRSAQHRHIVATKKLGLSLSVFRQHQ